MLSYEEIFRRHSRPVTFLNGHLDSPVTRIPTPMIRRSQIAYKGQRRPTSMACLDSFHHYREKDPAVPRIFSDDHRLGSTDSTVRILNEGFKLPLKENTQRISRYANNYSALEDIEPRISSDIHRLPAKDRLPNENHFSKENSPRILSDTYRYPTRNNMVNTATTFEPNYHSLPRKNPMKENIVDTSISRDIGYRSLRRKRPARDNVVNTATAQEPTYHSLRRKSPVRESKSSHLSDNYRHAVSFPDSHLSRRELPLCTPDELLDIIREPTGYYALPTDPWNEVYPDVYLSDAPTALCTAVLKRLGITHVLNAAQGREKGCGQVNTTSGFYLNSGIKFLGVPAFDNIVFRIYPYFEEAAQFIDDGLKAKGKVLVHCRAGISRSATLVCAFLMIKKGMTVQEAVKIVRKHREIIPNDGFLQQLCDLNDRLKRKNKSYAS